MNSRFFDELGVGDTVTTRRMTLTEGQIVDFACQYDPQHMHVDKVSAEQGQFGGLIASGFQTMAISFRLFFETGVVVESNIIGPGMDAIRWTAPVYPGDTIHGVWEVLETTPSKSKLDRGSVRWGVTVINQKGDTVMTYEPIMVMRKRPA